MAEYWESKYNEIGTSNGFEPADSTLFALNLFVENSVKNVLIPGFGYGRNAKLFCDRGIEVTGIEISQTAIDLARKSGLDCTIHHGSITSMPFDDAVFDAVFCYATLHLLNRKERKAVLLSCYDQLKEGGLMVFTLISKDYEMYGTGRKLSSDRYRLMNGLNVYFYDTVSVKREFLDYGLIEVREIDEPIKFMKDQNPLKCIMAICRKHSNLSVQSPTE